MPLKADLTDEMATLNKYIRILKRLNYSNVVTKIHTNEVMRYDDAQSAVIEYYSSILLSIDTPNGKSINVSCSGTNPCKKLAEREAARYAVNFLSKHCLSNGIHHINEGNEFNALLEKENSKRKLSSSLNDFTQLPFFNEGYVGSGGIVNHGVLYQPPSIRSHQNAITNSYQSSLQNSYGRRHYSRQSASSNCETSVVPDNLIRKKIDIEGLFKSKEDVNLNTPENSAVSQFDQEHADTVKLFESPKNFLGNLYYNIQVSMKSDVPLRNYKVQLTNNKEWLCTLQVMWPENSVFKGVASTKKEAARRATILCLEWLQKLGKIDSQGRLKVLNKDVLVNEIRKPLAEININESYVASAEKLINYFTASNLEKRLKTILEEWEESDLELCTDFTKKEDINKQISENLLMKRNRDLYNRLCERKSYMENSSMKLPIAAFHSKITDLINKNQVVILKGEPGCGKSTQVPQIIIDDYTEKMRATDCNIVCTQPRRISAITLAERIASERNEMVGDVVGYQVRLDSVKPRRDRSCILLCSTGIMLRKLLSNPGMDGISHLIIDEAHERDLNTDLLLLMTKRAAARNPNLKVIIMSATINPELFQNYFENSAVLHIPGFTYPVESHYLDSNISKITGLKLSTQSKYEFPVVDVKAIAALVTWINRNKPPGAILVFLPGWADISRLLKDLNMSNRLLVLPVHSRLSYADQKKIFCTPPSGVRKVILATNIAETSITIDDVNYVIDSGAHKEERLQHGMLAIDNQWISQASARQRRGRAGRVRPGECYHLYPKEKYESFDEFPIPEVRRARLETTVLASKVYSGNEKAETFLKQLPEPPKVEMIQDAVKKLRWAGALDEDENLTPLGTRISVFTTHPLISKALVHSYFFKCVNLMVSVGTILSSDVDLFRGVMGDKSVIRTAKQKYNPSSDHLATALMFQEWEKYNVGASDYGYDIRGKRLADKLNANNDGFRLIGKLRHLVGEHLYQCGLLDSISDYDDKFSDCNSYSSNNELLKGVLLSGLGNVLSTRNWDVKKGILKKKNVVLTESSQRATISSESVNHKRTKFPSPFMTYFTEVRSEQQRSLTIRDTSIVSPLTLVLFQCATFSINKCEGTATDLNLKPDQVIISLVNKQYENSKKTLNIVCNERTAQAIMKLRRIMWAIIGYLVRESGQPLHQEFQTEILNFHEKLLSLLNKILLEQSTYIDRQDELQKRDFS